jgi:hypothetical protein
MQLYGQAADFLPNAKADVSADWRQKGILKLRSVGMPSLERLEERRTVGSGVVDMPQTDDGSAPIRFTVVLVAHPSSHRARLPLKRLATSGRGDVAGHPHNDDHNEACDDHS